MKESLTYNNKHVIIPEAQLEDSYMNEFQAEIQANQAGSRDHLGRLVIVVLLLICGISAGMVLVANNTDFFSSSSSTACRI